MKTWLRLALVAIALAQSAAAFAITVRGARSCGVWIKDRGMGGWEHLADEAWLAGYLSGLAVGSDEDFWGKKDIDSLDNEGVYLWVDNYCRANPLNSTYDAADELFKERMKKKAGS